MGRLLISLLLLLPQLHYGSGARPSSLSLSSSRRLSSPSRHRLLCNTQRQSSSRRNRNSSKSNRPAAVVVVVSNEEVVNDDVEVFTTYYQNFAPDLNSYKDADCNVTPNSTSSDVELQANNNDTWQGLSLNGSEGDGRIDLYGRTATATATATTNICVSNSSSNGDNVPITISDFIALGSATTTSQRIFPHRRKKKRESALKAEGRHLLRNVFNIGLRTSHGICRAVNVTGGLASTLAGSSFKLIGGALQDVSAGMDIANDATPVKVPVLDKGWVYLAEKLKKAGDTIYSVGVAAEDAAKNATQVAEDSLRLFAVGVLENAEDTTRYLLRLDDDFHDANSNYLDDVDDRIEEYVELEPANGLQAPLISDGQLPPPRHLYSHQYARPPKKKGFRLTSQRFRRQCRALVKTSLERSGNIPTMGLQSLMACAACSFMGRLTASRKLFRLALLVGCRYYLKYMEGVYRECVADRMLADLKFEAIGRLQAGKPERARWFNTGVAEVWYPLLCDALSNLIKERLNILLEEVLPPDIPEVKIDYFTMGTAAPVVRYVQVQNYTMVAHRVAQAHAAAGAGAAAKGTTGACSGGGVGSATGPTATTNIVLEEVKKHGDMEENFGNVTTKGLFYAELGINLQSDESKLIATVSMRKTKGFTLGGFIPPSKVKAKNIDIQVKVVMAMRFEPEQPYLHEMWFSLAEEPRLNLGTIAVTGIDIPNIPSLRRSIHQGLITALAPLINPERIHWVRRSLEERIAMGVATPEEIRQAKLAAGELKDDTTTTTTMSTRTNGDEDDDDDDGVKPPPVKMKRFTRLKYLRPGKFIGLVAQVGKGVYNASRPQQGGEQGGGGDGGGGDGHRQHRRKHNEGQHDERKKAVEKGISVFVDRLGLSKLTVPPDDEGGEKESVSDPASE